MKTTLWIAVATATILFTGSFSTSAQEAKKLPEGKSVLKPGIEGHRLNSGPNGEGEFKIIEVKDKPFKKAIQAKVKKVPGEVWHTQISTLLAEPVKRGDVILISFHARSVETKGGSGRSNIYFGTPETELDVTVGDELTLSKEWKHFQIPATIADDYEAEKGMLNFDFGSAEQTLEFADIKLVNHGKKVKESELPRSGN